MTGKQNDYGVEFVGPFVPQHSAVVDGYLVPHLTLISLGNSRVSVFLDNRFGIELDETEARKVIPFIANAMAVAAGFSCIGKNCQPQNLFNVRCAQLGTPVE